MQTRHQQEIKSNSVVNYYHLNLLYTKNITFDFKTELQDGWTNVKSLYKQGFGILPSEIPVHVQCSIILYSITNYCLCVKNTDLATHPTQSGAICKGLITLCV